MQGDFISVSNRHFPNQVIKRIQEDINFADVTLVSSDGRTINAHKVFLSSTSEFFHEMFSQYNHPHPLIFMKDCTYDTLNQAVEFMYSGQVSLLQENLDKFLELSQYLKLFHQPDVLLQSNNQPLFNESPEIQEVLSSSSENIILEQSVPGSTITEQKEHQNWSGTKYSKMERKENKDIEIFPATRSPTFTIWLEEERNSVQLSIAQLEKLLLSKMEKTTIAPRLWACKVCRHVNSKPNLSKHIELIHLNDISFHCNSCGKIIQTRDLFHEHIKDVHIK